MRSELNIPPMLHSSKIMDSIPQPSNAIPPRATSPVVGTLRSENCKACEVFSERQIGSIVAGRR